MYRKILLFTIALASLFALYIGAYLPYEKSRRFIEAYRLAARAETMQEFQTIFDSVLNFYSPVGQREEVRFLTSQIFDLISRQKPPYENAISLTRYVESKYEELPNSDNPAFGVQTIMFLGDLWRYIGLTYKDAESTNKAENYYLQGLVVSPRRPQFLYALYSLYVATGNQSRARDMYFELIAYWPNDPALQQVTQ